MLFRSSGIGLGRGFRLGPDGEGIRGGRDAAAVSEVTSPAISRVEEEKRFRHYLTESQGTLQCPDNRTVLEIAFVLRNA